METAAHTIGNPAAAGEAPAVAPMDLADLVSVLVSLGESSREVDNVIEAMLGGDRVEVEIGPSAVISSRWLSRETPSYTAGGTALSVLAHRRGYRIAICPDGNGFRAEVRNLATGRIATASARIEGAAGVAAICSLAARETARA